MQQLSQELVSQTLSSSIASLFERRDVFLNNPQSDFTRTKKISFEKTILFPMVAGSDNVANEILDLFGEDGMPPPSSSKCIEGRRGINQVHLNLLYDPLNDVFLDVEIQGIHEMDEKSAFSHLLDNQARQEAPLKTIYLADRDGNLREISDPNRLIHYNTDKTTKKIPFSRQSPLTVCLPFPKFIKSGCKPENWLYPPCEFIFYMISYFYIYFLSK